MSISAYAASGGDGGGGAAATVAKCWHKIAATTALSTKNTANTLVPPHRSPVPTSVHELNSSKASKKRDRPISWHAGGEKERE